MGNARDTDDLVDTLCHYTTGAAAFQHIVPSGKLRMSPYARMRDPLENRELSFAREPSEGDERAQPELMDDVVDRIHVIRNMTRLLSFTVDATTGYKDDDLPFMRGWARARMWEQYGENHAGVCIAFDRQRALSHILDDLQGRGPFEHGDVVYTPRGFSDTHASTLQVDEFDGDDLASTVASFIVEHEHELFFRKTLDWQSEREYRVTLVTDADEGDYIFVPFGDAKSLRAVILGENFPNWQFPAAKWACDQVGVTLLKMQWLVGMPWPMPAD